jgi:threonine dehydratase
MARSLAAEEVRHNPAVRHTIMDGISGPVAGELPLEVLLRHGVKGLTVDDDEALAAVATAYYTLKTVIEPAARHPWPQSCRRTPSSPARR